MGGFGCEIGLFVIRRLWAGGEAAGAFPEAQKYADVWESKVY